MWSDVRPHVLKADRMVSEITGIMLMVRSHCRKMLRRSSGLVSTGEFEVDSNLAIEFKARIWQQTRKASE